MHRDEKIMIVNLVCMRFKSFSIQQIRSFKWRTVQLFNITKAIISLLSKISITF